MGSRSKIDLAYIAGFLDGDGSLMLQIKKRKDGQSKIRFMATICFYQDSRHEKTLKWIRQILGAGYFSRRNDGMSELRVNGYQQVLAIIESLLPYVKFKKVQAKALSQACAILTQWPLKTLQKKQLLKLVDLILVIQKENYATKSKKTKQELLSILGLTP